MSIYGMLRRNKRLLLFICSSLFIIHAIYLQLVFITDLDFMSFTSQEHLTSRSVLSTAAWLEQRQRHLQKGTSIKVFLFAYMRGGSSVAGELFNCDPSATMWYEPGDAFFSAYYGLYHENLPQNDMYLKNMTRRKLRGDEASAMLDFYSSTLASDYERLPPEAMAHYFLSESTAMDSYVRCTAGNRTKHVTINACKHHISDICSENHVETAIGAKCHIAIAAVRAAIRRYPDIKTEKHLLSLLQNLQRENKTDLPHTDWRSIVKFVRHGFCVEILRQDNAKCMSRAPPVSRVGGLQVLQVLRMKMEDLEPLIRANPDIYVLHYTRDPRGIALSRIKTGKLIFDTETPTTVREAEYLCDKMREDVKQRRILEARYPDVFRHLTYESLATDPEGTAKRFYAIFNRTYPEKWNGFIARHMNGRGESAGFGITVRNATKTAYRWRSKISQREIDTINGFCADVITTLGYEL